ncbi:Nif3-like dinuclear metal center hexameric protein [Salinactinospora qingdaonensis]|uniref:Nif3-like dinuclear metal center hexameric protein n=1 Tax=Salinactinospora qingdaonensis TaxID=702744 RepID=UPI0031EB0236
MTLHDVIEAFEGSYDPAWAASWDAVGLVCGEPTQRVRRIVFAVDPVADVVDEALHWGADLIVTHHPLLLRGVSSVAATTPKGRLIHRLISAGTALYTAHTNADTAAPGVSDALAAAVGLEPTSLRPLAPDPTDPTGRRGIGRIGTLPQPMPLRAFVEQVRAGLPATATGVRAAGDPERRVATVAVSGGAGDSLLETARAAGVDVYLTSDLRHHPSSEFVEHGDIALIDTAHWASEWPWLTEAAKQLTHVLASQATNVETRVSTIVTDAWSQAL